MLNVISYTESHVNGPFAEPFKSIDVLGNGNKQANDVLRIFNGDVYSLSLTATTFFNRQAQSVGYQLTSRPSPRSTLLLGGSFLPGPGNGFDRTSVQVSTPFGYQSDLQILHVHRLESARAAGEQEHLLPAHRGELLRDPALVQPGHEAGDREHRPAGVPVARAQLRHRPDVAQLDHPAELLVAVVRAAAPGR